MSNFEDMRTINLEKSNCVAVIGYTSATNITNGRMLIERPFVRIGLRGISQLNDIDDITWLVQFNIADSDQAKALGNVFNKLADKMKEDE